MKLFDSHCHINSSDYKKDLEMVLKRAEEAGVIYSMVAGVTEESCEHALKMADTYNNLFLSIGIHPHDASTCTEDVLSRLKKMGGHAKVKAWGETGLDFNRMFSPIPDQEKWLIRQIELASELDLPLIFHERDSGGRFLEILSSFKDSNIRGVVHCFSGSRSDLEAYLELGFHIGITGIVTVKMRGAELRGMLPDIPADRILIETDAPYLTPTPERNKFKRNEPAFVKTVMKKIAEVRGEDLEELADTVFNNTCSLYGI